MATLFYNEDFSRREKLLLNFANYFGQVAINLIKKNLTKKETALIFNSRPRSTPYKRGLIDW